MLTDYNDLSEETKTFVYPSSRKFYDTEIQELKNEISSFLEENFKEFKTHFKILHQRILVFFIEGETISITLLDNLAQFIMELEQKYTITLLDKINVCFKQGEHVQYQEMKKFRELIKNKSISKKTIIINNFTQNKYDFEHNFEVPIDESWLSHLIK